MSKIDVLILLVAVAAVGALAIPPHQKQEMASRTPAAPSKNGKTEITGGPLRLNGLVIGMTKAEVESISGGGHSTEDNPPYETWDWAKGSGTMQHLTFYDGKLLTISTPVPARLLKSETTIDTSSSAEIARTLGKPADKTAEHIVYHYLPGELVFQLKGDQVVSVSWRGQISKNYRADVP